MLRGPKPVHEDVEEPFDGLFVGERDVGVSVHVFLHGVVFGDSGEGENDDGRVELAEGAGGLALRDVFFELRADGHGHLRVVHECEFVAFERGVHEEAAEPRLFTVELQDFFQQKAEQALIVIYVDERLKFGHPVDGAVAFAFDIEDGLVEVLFGGEMTEDDGFGDAGGGCDFFGGGAAEAFLGEQFDGDVEELAPAVVAGHSLVEGGIQGHPLIISKYLLNWQVLLEPARLGIVQTRD